MATIYELTQELTYALQSHVLPLFNQAAHRYGLPVTLLLAIASRESKIGSDAYYLAHHGIGTDGVSTGIMQVNALAHPVIRGYDPLDDRKIIDYASGYIARQLHTFGDIRFALDAYNAGAESVKGALSGGRDPDSVTTGADYGTDVLHRQALIVHILNQNPAYKDALRKPLPLIRAGMGKTVGIVLGTLLIGSGFYELSRQMR